MQKVITKSLYKKPINVFLAKATDEPSKFVGPENFYIKNQLSTFNSIHENFISQYCHGQNDKRSNVLIIDRPYK